MIAESIKTNMQTFNELVNHGVEMNICLVRHDPSSGQDLEPSLLYQLLQTVPFNLRKIWKNIVNDKL